jgi:hypothetical protein
MSGYTAYLPNQGYPGGEIASNDGTTAQSGAPNSARNNGFASGISSMMSSDHANQLYVLPVKASLTAVWLPCIRHLPQTHTPAFTPDHLDPTIQ